MRALVVGGTGAVGREIVELLLQRNLEVFSTSRRGEQVDSRVITLKWEASEKFNPPGALCDGGPKLLVFYCVGTPSTKNLVRDTPIEEFSELFDKNALGFVRVYKAIRDCTFGDVNIVAISSDATMSARSRNGPYSVSKTALETVAHTIVREEEKEGFRLNIVAPSLIDSPMARRIKELAGEPDFEKAIRDLPQNRAIAPKEVAQAAVDIAMADQWSYANGQVFRLSSLAR